MTCPFMAKDLYRSIELLKLDWLFDDVFEQRPVFLDEQAADAARFNHKPGHG